MLLRIGVYRDIAAPLKFGEARAASMVMIATELREGLRERPLISFSARGTGSTFSEPSTGSAKSWTLSFPMGGARELRHENVLEELFQVQ